MVCYYCFIEGHPYQHCPVAIYRINCKRNNISNTRWYEVHETLTPSDQLVPNLFCEICADTDHIYCNCPLLKRYNSRTGPRMTPEELYKYA